MPDDRKTAIKQHLTATREATFRAVAGLTDDQWNQVAYSEGEVWRVVDLLRHVADSEKSMTALMVQINAGGEGVPADFDLERWNRRTVAKLQEKSPRELLDGMVVNREALFAFLDTLEDEDFDRKGRHGSMRIMSIEEICRLIGDHEQLHVEEITRLSG